MGGWVGGWVEEERRRFERAAGLLLWYGKGKQSFIHFSPPTHAPTHSMQILALPRPVDIPDDGILCDLLWSDPDASLTGWARNPRGVSHLIHPPTHPPTCTNNTSFTHSTHPPTHLSRSPTSLATMLWRSFWQNTIWT